MNKLLILPILLATALTSYGAPFSEQPSPSQLAPMASIGLALTVNDDAVTSAEILAQLEPDLFRPSTAADSDALPDTPQPRRQLIGSLAGRNRAAFVEAVMPIIHRATLASVSGLLLYQHAKLDLEKTPGYEEAMEAAMAEQRKNILARYQGSLALAQAQLQEAGTSLDEQLKQAKRQLVVSGYRQAHFDDPAQISRSEMFQYYNAHLKEDYSHTSLIQFQLIDIPFDAVGADSSHPNAQSLARQAAQQAWQEIQDGMDFDQAVAKHSHGYRKNYHGLWRPVDPDSLLAKYQPVAQALAQVDLRQCTGIIQGAENFFIAKLIDRTEAKIVPFSQVQFQITEILRDRRWLKYRDQLISTLFKKATIGDLDRFVRNTAQVAYDQFAR